MHQDVIKIINCPNCGTPIARNIYRGTKISVRCPYCKKNWHIDKDGIIT